MANAAAKKSAAAKVATATIYKPLLLGTNVLYVILLLGFDTQCTIRNMLGMLVTWGFQAYAYVGILDQAANASGKGEKNLVGGAHLDLLALTLVVQYGTALHSSKWYWLLSIVPVWGGWTLYKTFYGGSKKGATSQAGVDPTTNDPSSEANAERRQKRAERRRQKRS